MGQTNLNYRVKKPDGPVECLGLSFENDEQRRAYFLDKLRDILKDKEFRKIEGFPIGSDEDILALSDPPYYTACPNPFFDEVIAFHGKQYDPSNSYIKEPFATDVTEGKNDVIYDSHPYHTKVPPKAIMRLLLHYTNPGDVVLDAFSGSGMLGVAASLCEEPLKHIGSFIGIPGKRYAILSDISPLATSIANINTRPKISSDYFTSISEIVCNNVSKDLKWMYTTKHSKNSYGDVLYYIWSEYYECDNCNTEICAWDTIVDRDNSILRKSFNCPSCSKLLEKDKLVRVKETYYDTLLNTTATRNKSKIALIHYKYLNKRFEKKPDSEDIEKIERIESMPFPNGVVPVKMNFKDVPWGDLYRAGYHAGVTHAHHFFTKRNLITLFSLKNEARKTDIGNEMMFILTGFVDNHASKRNRYIIDVNHPNGTTCGPLSNSLFLPELQCEVNPFNTWKKTAKKQAKSFSIKRPSCSFISTESSSFKYLPDMSVDYIFVDPPFGENIFYSESSFCWEYFLGVFTNSKSEAVISKCQNKSIDAYRKLIEHVLTECYRVLKPGRWMTIEFSNRSNAVWNALSEAILNAGFVIADVRVFDKVHGAIRQDMGQSIKKDLIISAYRPNGGLEDRFTTEAGTVNGVWDFVRTHLKQLPVCIVSSGLIEVIAERQAHILFDRMVAFHVKHNVSVPLSSSEFHIGLVQRFSERDGMFFLPEQVAEYDKKRINFSDIKQLELFVIDEVSAIQWLRISLSSKPQTFPDIHPQFIKEIRGWSKHEKRLELLELLKLNFLEYDGMGDVPSQIHSYLSSNFKELRNLPKDSQLLKLKSKNRWYVPDPNKAQDLEKLRDKALMKEFDEYRSFSGRKLKTFRLEAIRAGFKKAWSDKNYSIIIDVAQKVPEDVLQEDSKLTMWYDGAMTRMGD